MLKNIINFIFQSPNERKTKQQNLYYEKLCNEIESKSEQLSKLNEQEFKQEISNLINYYKALPEHERNMQNIKKLNEQEIINTFSLIRESAFRFLKLRHYHVQLIGGLALTQQLIAEMRTGEGKTLTAALPSIYYALKTQKPIHIVTANSYLAERDSQIMKPLYEAFGLTVGFNFTPNEKSELNFKNDVFKSNIIYSAASELALDYLRSSTQTDINKIYIRQNDMNYVIIDEADFILLDSAKEAVILAEAVPFDSTHLKWARETALKLTRSENDYVHAHKLIQNQKYLDLVQEDVEKLRELDRQQNKENNPEYNKNYFIDDLGNIIQGDFYLDEIQRSVNFFENAYDIIENELQVYGFYEKKTFHDFIHLVEQAIIAEYALLKDRDYIVKEDAVIMINTATGRPMGLSRWEDGLHQAVEHKESVSIQDDSRILASITYQSFFNMYQYKSGMTGTAKTEEEELQSIYGLHVFSIPTNKPSKRIDNKDVMFVSDERMYEKIVEIVKERITKNQPILIGTPNMNVSESIASLLNKDGIPFNLLSAKNLRNEAKIIAEAGQPSCVTISTNMSGRGTDIILGGDINGKIMELDYLLKSNQINQSAYDKRVEKITNEWKVNNETVVNAGGLLVICVGLNESRRISNQLKGRCARQGDVGETMSFYSLDDPFIIHTSPKSTIEFTKNQIEKLGINSTSEIPPQYDFFDWGRIAAKSQKMVENVISQQRKNTLKYENIQNKQRLLFNKMKEQIVELNDVELKETLVQYIQEYLDIEIKNHIENPKELVDLYHKEDLINTIKNIIVDLNQKTSETLKEYSQTIIDEFESKSQDEKDNEKIIQYAVAAIILIHDLRWKGVLLLGDKKIETDFIKKVFLTSMSNMWYDYLNDMELLKRSSKFVVYAQRNPYYEFSKVSNDNFIKLLNSYSHRAIKELFSEPIVEKIEIDNILEHMKNHNVDASNPNEILKFLDSQVGPAMFQSEILNALSEQQVK